MVQVLMLITFSKSYWEIVGMKEELRAVSFVCISSAASYGIFPSFVSLGNVILQASCPRSQFRLCFSAWGVTRL